MTENIATASSHCQLLEKVATASSWSAERVEIAVSGGMEKAVKYIANAAIVIAFILSSWMNLR